MGASVSSYPPARLLTRRRTATAANAQTARQCRAVVFQGRRLTSMSAHGCRNACPRVAPLIVGLEAHPQPVVVHAQDALIIAAHGIRPYELHLLRNHADISLVAAVVAEAVESKPVVETAEIRNVVLDADVGAAAAAAAATTSAHAATSAAHAAATSHAHATAAAAA